MSVREILVIVVLVLVGIWLMGSRNAGPVERAVAELQERGMHGPGDGHNHGEAPQAQPAGHPGEHLQPADGDPLITLGEYKIGDSWFAQAVELTAREYAAEGYSESAAHEIAEEEMLLLALKELIILKYIDEFEAGPDQATIDRRREEFEARYEDEAARGEYLHNMGMTMEQIEELWDSEAVMVTLENKVFELEGIDPNSADAGRLFHEWLIEQVNTAGLEFHNEALRSMYDHSIEHGWTVQ